MASDEAAMSVVPVVFVMPQAPSVGAAMAVGAAMDVAVVLGLW